MLSERVKSCTWWTILIIISRRPLTISSDSLTKREHTPGRTKEDEIALSPASELDVCLIKKKYATAKKHDISFGSRGGCACRAAVGWQCNLPKRLWNSNVLLHNNAMCNQWMSDNLGGGGMDLCSLAAIWMPTSRAHRGEGEGESTWP